MKNSITTYSVSRSCDSDLICYSQKEANAASKSEKQRLIDGGFAVLADHEGIIKKEVNTYVTESGYSDAYPFEIVRIVSDITIEIRALDTELLNAKELKFHVGGFSAHCSNDRAQRYSYHSNEENGVIRIRKNKHGRWMQGRHRRFSLAVKPYKFHDNNF